MNAAREAGADFIGLVLDYAPSPRVITLEQATALSHAGMVPSVVVLVNPSVARFEEIAHSVEPAAAQLSGKESADAVATMRSRVPAIELWKVLHVSSKPASEEVDAVLEQAEEYRRAGVSRLMIDARVDGLPGGSGTNVSWDAVRTITRLTALPVLLAGGLTVVNVDQAITAAQPDGVDVSSGIESSPGIKDPDKMRRFVQAAREAFERRTIGNTG